MGIEQIEERVQNGSKGFTLISVTVTILLIIESASYHHVHYSKLDAQNRIGLLKQEIYKEIPTTLESPIIYVSYREQDYFDASEKYSMIASQARVMIPRTKFDVHEIDVMIAAQEMNLRTFNGFSGNSPPSYQFALSCAQIPDRLITYANIAKIDKNSETTFYLKTIHSIVAIGFQDCEPAWWMKLPEHLL